MNTARHPTPAQAPRSDEACAEHDGELLERSASLVDVRVTQATSRMLIRSGDPS